MAARAALPASRAQRVSARRAGRAAAGAASSSATNTDAGGVFTVEDSATATGGAGGQSFSIGGTGGAGGTIAVGAVKAFGSSVGDFVSATARASGGTGGNGVNGANGGAGGAANLTDAATGSTTGTFNPIQSATGGAGGLTFGPPAGSAGVGGAASSKLRVHDKSAASVIASSSAQGGLGGGTFGGVAGAGGGSRATLHLRSKVATHLEGSVTATGGSGGKDFSTGALAGAGGEANARDAVHANGGFGSARSVALGGVSDTSPGAASAYARVTGATTGGAFALSESRTTSSSVTATASAPGGGPASASTKASFGAGPPALAPIGAGEAVSDAVLTPADSTFAVGFMSAGYGGSGETLALYVGRAFPLRDEREGRTHLQPARLRCCGRWLRRARILTSRSTAPIIRSPSPCSARRKPSSGATNSISAPSTQGIRILKSRSPLPPAGSAMASVSLTTSARRKPIYRSPPLGQ